MRVMAPAPVISSQPWWKNWLALPTEPQVPEPAQLYSLIALALVLHTPTSTGARCTQCAQTWPCPQVRLAFRLREAF
jgi:hypothetical protein